MVKSLEMYIMIFFTYSFLGWTMESVGSIFKEKKFVNRGFLIGPYCPVYGTGVVLITLLLHKYTNDIPALFFLSTLLCGALEYLTSYLMEKLFNDKWWDYSDNKYNINGRVCLKNSILFGIAGLVVIYFIYLFIKSIYSMLSEIALKIIAYSLSTIYIIDMIISFKIILSFKKETYAQKDNTEEISEMVKDKAEDILMKAESDIIVFSRRLKLKELKMQRKLRYTRNQIYTGLKMTPTEFAERISESRKNINSKLQDSKEKMNMKMKDARSIIEQRQKESKKNLDEKMQNIRISSEEFTKEVKERFKNKSFLKSRLIDAFPDLKIEEKIHFKKK